MKSESATWSGRSVKFMALLVVAIMVVSAFIMLAPAAAPASAPVALAPAADEPASAQAGTMARQVTYTVSNIGESYLKDSRDVDGARGLHGSTPGLPGWWTTRQAAYSDTIVHNSYPYSIAYNPESSFNSYTGVTHMSFGTYSFYRLTMDATDISTVATGPNKDPLYVPVLGNVADDGGTLQLNWHYTYMTAQDVVNVTSGIGYVRTYYGVMPNAVNFQGSYANDGWYMEQSGKMTFDVAAAKKFLGLPGTGSLISEFNTANAAGALNASWGDHYLAEGGPGAIYDTIAAYDYAINSGPVLYFLKVDPASTATSLVLRMWGYSWGAEVLQMRYLDVQGLMKDFEGWSEDYYFNATITSASANIHTRSTMAYHMAAWKDPNYWGPAYMVEAQHYDYNDISGLWISRFTDYMPYRGYTPLRDYWMPGVNNIGAQVAYYNTPHVWNLASGETFIVKLPTGQNMGYMPYKGVVPDTFPKNGGGNDAKAVEMNQHTLAGEMVLGPGTFPNTLFSPTYYNAKTKTMTITGPTSFPRNPNPAAEYSFLNLTGSPMFMLDISPVSDYVLTLPAGPYTQGVPYTLTVTAKDALGATVATNFTVNLAASAGVTLGATTHVFVPAENGVWTTTATFTSAGGKSITAADSRFSLDVTGSITVPVDAFALNLVSGWNLVSVPRTGFGYKASTLGLLPGDVVAGYSMVTQTYNRSYTVGSSPPFKNFWIFPNEGYWIFTGQAETLYLQGSDPTGVVQTKSITVPTGGGWFIFGLSSFKTTNKASTLASWFSGGTVDVVAVYDPVPKTYRTWTPGSPPFKDFALTPGLGYWVHCTASGTVTYTG